MISQFVTSHMLIVTDSFFDARARTHTHKIRGARLPLNAYYNHYGYSTWPRRSLSTFRVIEGHSCDHRDKLLDCNMSHFNSASSSAQYS